MAILLGRLDPILVGRDAIADHVHALAFEMRQPVLQPSCRPFFFHVFLDRGGEEVGGGADSRPKLKRSRRQIAIDLDAKPAIALDACTYGSATSNGAAGMMIESSGWANAANNVPMAIKACDASQIDIAAPYSTTGVSSGMGALKVAETDTADVTLNIGQGIRVGAASAARSRSFEADNQSATSPYMGASGFMLNTLPFAIAGNGYVTLGPAGFMGQDYAADAAATRYSGTINTNSNIVKPAFQSSDGLSYCVVNGVNHFAGENLTGFGSTLNQNVTAPPDIGGRQTRPIVKAGPFMVDSASLSYTSDPGTLDAAIITLDRASGSAAEAPVDVKLSNGTEKVWMRLPRCVFNLQPRNVDAEFGTGSVEIGAMADGQDIGTFIFQSFAS